jgi:hypothetical protein
MNPTDNPSVRETEIIHRHRRRTFWVAVSSCFAAIIFSGFMYARYVDMPARQDPLPPELSHSLGTNAASVTAFYRYDLRGFIDHEWLWRIDANQEIIKIVIENLKLQKTNTVSPRFWQMPPHYWPRSMTAGAEAFQSTTFSSESRGFDGNHFFLVHDRTQDKAFVWFKSNF